MFQTRHPPTEHARGYANYWILIYIKEKLIVVEMPTCGLRVTACKTCDLVVCIPPQLLNTHGDGWLRRQHRWPLTMLRRAGRCPVVPDVSIVSRQFWSAGSCYDPRRALLRQDLCVRCDCEKIARRTPGFGLKVLMIIVYNGVRRR